MSKVKMSMELSPEVAEFLDKAAKDEGTTKTEIVRRALSVIKAYKSQKEHGRSHIGFVADANRLDAEIVGILDK